MEAQGGFRVWVAQFEFLSVGLSCKGLGFQAFFCFFLDLQVWGLGYAVRTLGFGFEGMVLSFMTSCGQHTFPPPCPTRRRLIPSYTDLINPRSSSHKSKQYGRMTL